MRWLKSLTVWALPDSQTSPEETRQGLHSLCPSLASNHRSEFCTLLGKKLGLLPSYIVRQTRKMRKFASKAWWWVAGRKEPPTAMTRLWVNLSFWWKDRSRRKACQICTEVFPLVKRHCLHSSLWSREGSGYLPLEAKEMNTWLTLPSPNLLYHLLSTD
jgi:hypothetical protein